MKQMKLAGKLGEAEACSENDRANKGTVHRLHNCIITVIHSNPISS